MKEVVTCPHCGSVQGTHTCHLCHGSRKVAVDTALAHARNIWARKGCECGACLAIGPMPRKDVEHSSVGPSQAVAAPVGPFETFRDAFTVRSAARPSLPPDSGEL
jgi:hypothetical protein